MTTVTEWTPTANTVSVIVGVVDPTQIRCSLSSNPPQVTVQSPAGSVTLLLYSEEACHALATAAHEAKARLVLAAVPA